MATKSNPGPFDCYGALKQDEPYFLLKATDATAPETVEVWADMYRDRKSEEGTYDARATHKYSEAMQCAAQMRIWREQQVADGLIVDPALPLDPKSDDTPADTKRAVRGD